MKLTNTKECDDTTFIEKVAKTMDTYFPHSVSVAKAQNTNKIDITTKLIIEPKAIIKTKDSSKVKTKPKKVKKSYISAKENTDELLLKVKKIIKKVKKTNIETEKEALIRNVEEEGKLLARKLIDEAQMSAKRIQEDSSNAVTAEFAEMRKKYKQELLENVFDKIRSEFSNENSRQKLHEKLIEGFLTKTENSSRGVRV